MVVYPLSWPGYAKISASTFGLNFHQTEFSSELSGKTGISELNSGKNDRWEGSFSVSKQTLLEGGKFLSFLHSLKGQQGTFLAFDPDRKQPSTTNGSFPGNGLVNGAGQTGRTLVTDGWPISSLILKTGDLVQVETQLLEISANVTTDGLGAATLTFQPALRSSPADGSQVITSNPVMIARLKERETFLETLPMYSNEKTILFEEVI